MIALIGCEESQAVTKAFRSLGHEAYSCDLQDCSGGHPEWHLKMDVFEAIKLVNPKIGIFHPPCTFLCVPGAHYLHTQQGRWENMEAAKLFFMKLYTSSIPHIAIENPVPHKYARLPAYHQIIHPWQFGHEVSKRTCLWLKNVPLLTPTDIKENKGDRYRRKDGSSSNSKWYASSNSKQRSKTFPGIAKAMAEQWSNILN